MSSNNTISPLSLADQPDFIRFTHQFIGENYYNNRNFKQQIQLSTQGVLNSSFVLRDQKSELVGIRVTYAPSTWKQIINARYLKSTNDVGYFKSLFIHPNHQNKGLGPLLSSKSIEVLKKMKARKILTHSWKESPNNSSVKYLEKVGFKPLGEVPNFWQHYDYLCSGCHKKPCLCTAVEMICELS